MARTRTAPLVIVLLVAASAGATTAARAEDCLAGPNGQSPQGRHWYYRLDRVSHRKCWYLGDLKRHRAAAQTNTRRSAAPPPEADEEDVAPTPARPAPDPAVSARSPEAAPAAAIVAGPRVASAPAPVASPTPAQEPIGARVVPTERVRTEAPPPKPAPAAKPQTVPAPAAGAAGGALPPVLFGIALLLAVVGTSLVLGRRRLTRPQRGYARSASEGRPRRSLSQILAQAEPVPEDSRAHAARFFDHIRRDRDESPAPPRAANEGAHAFTHARAAPRDIAAATLQPAIDPLVSEPIEPAPDVEQSLRALLAAWERRAA